MQHFSEKCCILGIRHVVSWKVQGTVKVRKFMKIRKKFEIQIQLKSFFAPQVSAIRTCADSYYRRNMLEARPENSRANARFLQKRVRKAEKSNRSPGASFQAARFRRPGGAGCANDKGGAVWDAETAKMQTAWTLSGSLWVRVHFAGA